MCDHERQHHGWGCCCESGHPGRFPGGPERPFHGEGGGHHPHGFGEGGPGPRPPMGFTRHFQTREERIARLETYLKGLKAETQAVEERIAEMKKAA